MSELIKRPAHVALVVPDLDASVNWATTVMGMRVTRREGGEAYLTHADCHHSLQYIEGPEAALDHVALEAHDGAALDTLTARLSDAGVELVASTPQEHGIDRAVRFLTPAGHLIEVFTGMADAGPVHTGTGIQPRKFAHPMLTALESGPTVAFFLDVLDFRLSDDVGDGVLVFMRCNPDHHGVAVSIITGGGPGPQRFANAGSSMLQRPGT